MPKSDFSRFSLLKITELNRENAPDLERGALIVEEAAPPEGDVGFTEVIQRRLDVDARLWIGPERPREHRVFHHHVSR